MTAVVEFADLEPGQEEQVGGKAAGLARLQRFGAPVPPGFALTVEAYRELVRSAGLGSQIDRILAGLDPSDTVDLRLRAGELRALVATAEMPAAVADEISAAYVRLAARTGEPEVPVAVRSSALGEDAEASSFAGEYDTFLWVSGGDAVLRHVQLCWASLFNAEAIAYRARLGRKGTDGAMAVAVQQMVRARAAGVMFTLHPATGDRLRIVVEGNWGLGRTVVDGEAVPDSFTVDKPGLRIIERRVAVKDRRCVPGAGGTVLEPMPEELRDRPCLTDDEVVGLATLGKKLEAAFLGPLDIEWAVDDGGIHLVQCRPETVWSARRPATRPSSPGDLADLVARSVGWVR